MGLFLHYVGVRKLFNVYTKKFFHHRVWDWDLFCCYVVWYYWCTALCLISSSATCWCEHKLGKAYRNMIFVLVFRIISKRGISHQFIAFAYSWVTWRLLNLSLDFAWCFASCRAQICSTFTCSLLYYARISFVNALSSEHENYCCNIPLCISTKAFLFWFLLLGKWTTSTYSFYYIQRACGTNSTLVP